MSWCIRQTYIQDCSEGKKKEENFQFEWQLTPGDKINIWSWLLCRPKENYKSWFPCIWNCLHLFGWWTLPCKKIIVYGLEVVSDQWFSLTNQTPAFAKVFGKYLTGPSSPECVNENFHSLDSPFSKLTFPDWPHVPLSHWGYYMLSS